MNKKADTGLIWILSLMTADGEMLCPVGSIISERVWERMNKILRNLVGSLVLIICILIARSICLKRKTPKSEVYHVSCGRYVELLSWVCQCVVKSPSGVANRLC